MTLAATLRRHWVTVTAFFLVLLGTLAVVPRGDEKADATKRIPTLVVTKSLDDGSSAAIVRTAVEVRDLDPEARASGALSSLDEIPEGVLVSDHVVGEQLLVSSFATDVVAALGPGFVSVSIRLDAQRWVGPFLTTGEAVDVFDVSDTGSTKIASKAVIIEAPSAAEVGPRDESIVTMGVPSSALPAVLSAAGAGRIWLVGA